jgi:hypothetical protein
MSTDGYAIAIGFPGKSCGKAGPKAATPGNSGQAVPGPLAFRPGKDRQSLTGIGPPNWANAGKDRQRAARHPPEVCTALAGILGKTRQELPMSGTWRQPAGAGSRPGTRCGDHTVSMGSAILP